MKILRIFLLLTSLIIFANAGDGHKKHKHFYKNLEYLDLNKKQLKEIKNVLIEFKHKYKDFYEYKDDKEDILEDIMEDEDFDKELYFQTLIDLKTRATKLEVEKMSKIHKILNEKQREKFADYLEDGDID
ncbi:Spy/CpxP family protein refolding chaperone [Poseidonibacter antarcticus]|uniref:Spy/CpxP family protein refolding chaperone n=1 Tax=Poseidonibacter antarcticus TaxID=2478538 RepID=UPI000EF4A162|nr:hypothetical protein [Poseidonibacter antarcticus]